jgi:hypothetical protein
VGPSDLPDSTPWNLLRRKTELWSRFSLSRSEAVYISYNRHYPALSHSLQTVYLIMRRQKTEPISSTIGQRRRSLSDPLAAALRPPENESPDERQRRLHAEEEARRVSNDIDDMIRAEKKENRLKQEVKVLLLGQSESGKSTTLKREWIGSPSSDSIGVVLDHASDYVQSWMAIILGRYPNHCECHALQVSLFLWNCGIFCVQLITVCCSPFLYLGALKRSHCATRRK